MHVLNTIMYGDTLHYNRHLALKIGQYCQFHEEDTPRNSQAGRKQSVICLGLRANTRGGFKFMSIHSSNNITIRIWNAIRMPYTVIA